jgi:hypothetical protein
MREGTSLHASQASKPVMAAISDIQVQLLREMPLDPAGYAADVRHLGLTGPVQWIIITLSTAIM